MEAGLGAQAVAIMGTYDIAQEWEVTPRWVRALATREGVGIKLHGSGKKDKSIWIFTPEDKDLLERARRPVGRPRIEEPTRNGNGENPNTG